MAGIQKNADIAFSIRVLRKMNQIICTPFFINSFLRIFKVWGDCSFVVEEAEAWILWELTEAHQKTTISKTQKSSKKQLNCLFPS